MKIVIQCPSCLVKLKVDEKVEGRTVACPKCKEQFTARQFTARQSTARQEKDAELPSSAAAPGPTPGHDDPFGQSFPNEAVSPSPLAASPQSGLQAPTSSAQESSGFSISYRFRETIKGICLLLIAVSFGGGMLAWFAVDRPDATTWLFRCLSLVVGTLSLGGFLFVHFQKGQVPDLLGTFTDEWYDCEGFGFALQTEKQGERCQFQVVFQNRYANPCLARLILRPTRKLFGKQDETAITLEVACPGGGFGFASFPIPVQPEWVGTEQSFDLIAGVKYPDGRGATLHYGEGSVFLRSRASFDSAFESTLTAVALLGGTILSFKPASALLRIPYGVESGFSVPPLARTQILWKPGEPLPHEDDLVSRFGKAAQ